MSKSIDDHVNEIYSILSILKKDEIVDKASRMVKDMSHETIGGIMQVPARFIKELDRLFYELDCIQNRKPYKKNK